jgi:hypothetical protein
MHPSQLHEYLVDLPISPKQMNVYLMGKDNDQE